MAKGFIGASGHKAYLGGTKMKKGYIGASCVYSAGSVVTYHVDIGIAYQEEVDEGESCLSPKTFAPTKAGWTFVGWRQDGAASGSVLGSLAMGDGPVELYAVFSLPVTVSYYNGNATKNTTGGYRYYNNGSVANPSFTLTQAALGGWTARGWSTQNAGNAAITYANGATFTRDSDITLYGLYQQTITLSYSGNGNTGGSTAAQTGTRYYAPAGFINPSFTIKANGFVRSGYIFTGWMSGSTSYAVGQSVTLSSNLTLTAQWYTAAASNFSYNGNIQTYVVPVSGLYLLTCYGARGGNATIPSATRYGGNGGTTKRYVALNKGLVLYIVCGGAGGDNGTTRAGGGYNGGGMSGYGAPQGVLPGGGGGATHIAMSSGILSSVPIGNLLAVAGGGGGAGDGSGGVGGGESGGTGYHVNGEIGGTGGTQSGGYSYGKGQDSTAYYTGGGGAGLYGGKSGNQGTPGGGGSGYIGSATTTYGGKTYNNSTAQGGGSGNGSASIALITI